MTTVLPTTGYAIGALARRLNRTAIAGLRGFAATCLVICGLTAVATAGEMEPVKGNFTIRYEKASEPATEATPVGTKKPCAEGKIRFGEDCVADGPRDPDKKASPPVKVAAEPDEPAGPSLFPREVQTELARLGCLTGAVDGDWGGGSEAALKKFYVKADRSSRDLSPTRAALNATKSERGKICAPTQVRERGCERGYEKDRRGRCVRECRSGQERDRRGRCVAAESPQMPPDHGDGTEECRRGFDRATPGGPCVRVRQKAPVKQPTRCMANAHAEGANCRCNPPYVPVGQQCVLPKPKAPAPAPKKCPPNAHAEGNNCRCNPGLDAINGQCVKPRPKAPAQPQCNPGYFFHKDLGRCMPQQRQAPPAAAPQAPGRESCQSPPNRWYQGRCVPG